VEALRFCQLAAVGPEAVAGEAGAVVCMIGAGTVVFHEHHVAVHEFGLGFIAPCHIQCGFQCGSGLFQFHNLQLQLFAVRQQLLIVLLQLLQLLLLGGQLTLRLGYGGGQVALQRHQLLMLGVQWLCVLATGMDPKKDGDAFHPVNVGKIMIGNYDFVPCTPAGVMELIKESGIDISGKECVIVGRSNIVGKPMSMLLLHQNGTVTVCHSRTKDLKEVTKRADILVVAVGRPEFITGDMIKEGAVVIDVGINRLENKKLVGDVEFESAEKVASAITPVPGGVGPMTIEMLMKNTLKAAVVNKED